MEERDIVNIKKSKGEKKMQKVSGQHTKKSNSKCPQDSQYTTGNIPKDETHYKGKRYNS